MWLRKLDPQGLNLSFVMVFFELKIGVSNVMVFHYLLSLQTQIRCLLDNKVWFYVPETQIRKWVDFSKIPFPITTFLLLGSLIHQDKIWVLWWDFHTFSVFRRKINVFLMPKGDFTYQNANSSMSGCFKLPCPIKNFYDLGHLIQKDWISRGFWSTRTEFEFCNGISIQALNLLIFQTQIQRLLNAKRQRHTGQRRIFLNKGIFQNFHFP